MQVKFIICPKCKTQFQKSSRHKYCSKCRYYQYKNYCKCGELKSKKSTVCRNCSNNEIKDNFQSEILSGMSFAIIKARKRKFTDIEVDDILNIWIAQQGKCALSSIPLELPNSKSSCRDIRTCASLDRIDSNGGYTKDNVQWVSASINYLKGSLSQRDTIELISWIRNNNASCY